VHEADSFCHDFACFILLTNLPEKFSVKPVQSSFVKVWISWNLAEASKHLPLLCLGSKRLSCSVWLVFRSILSSIFSMVLFLTYSTKTINILYLLTFLSYVCSSRILLSLCSRLDLPPCQWSLMNSSPWRKRWQTPHSCSLSILEKYKTPIGEELVPILASWILHQKHLL